MPVETSDLLGETMITKRDPWADSPKTSITSTPRPPLQGMRILVVDDDCDTAETLAMLLEMDGAQASACTSAQSALQTLGEGHWDAVLLDIGMPVMDGVEVAQAIRDRTVGSRLFVAAVTGHVQGGIYDRIAEAEFDLVFTKPADPEHLCRALAAWWKAPSKKVL